jgi:hypothetical protein
VNEVPGEIIMADQANGWQEAGKWIAGVGAFIASIRAYFRARNVNHADRIVRLEHQNKELRRVMNDAVEQLNELASTVDIDRGVTDRRFQRVEGDLRETKRIYREKLLEIADALVSPLHNGSGQQPEQR